MTPHVIWTLRAIARHLGVAEEETVLAFARRNRDPLRLHFIFGKHWIKTERLYAWKRRQVRGNEEPKIEGLAKIAARLGVSVNTVKVCSERAVGPLPLERDGRRFWIYEYAALDWLDAEDRLIDPVPLTVARATG